MAEYQCPGCKRNYKTTEADFVIFHNGGVIQVQCLCESAKRLNVLLEGRKQSGLVDVFGAAVDVQVVKLKSPRGQAIMDNYNPVVRYIGKRKV